MELLRGLAKSSHENNERGVDGGGEAVWESSLVGCFEGCALGGESCGGWVVSLHKLCEPLCEVNYERVFSVLGI